MKSLFIVFTCCFYVLWGGECQAQTDVICMGAGARVTVTGNTGAQAGCGWLNFTGSSAASLPHVCLATEDGQCTVQVCNDTYCYSDWLAVANHSGEELHITPTHGDLLVIPAYQTAVLPMNEPRWFETFVIEFCPEG